MGEPIGKRRNTTGTGQRPPRRALFLATGLAVTAGLSGCGFFEDSLAVTYEVEVVSGNSEEADLQVEYLDRETGSSQQQTIGDTVLADETTPATFETLGRADDEVSISVQGEPDAILRCAILLEGSEVIEEEESPAAGDAVTCAATLQD